MGRRQFYHSVSVDVDIDASVLEENGYHHEEDCESLDHEAESYRAEVEANQKILLEWHDRHHRLSLWSGCPYEPCRSLTEDFRSM